MGELAPSGTAKKLRNLRARWKPGESGNPAGRAKGSGLAGKLRKAIADSADDIVLALIAQAKAGDVGAARVLLERALPAYKATAQPVALPGLADGTLTDKAQAVIAAAGAGDVAPDIAAQLVAAIGQTARVVEIEELQERIEAIERTLEKAK